MTSDCMQMQGRMCNVHELDYACHSCFPDFSLSLLHFCQILENFFFLLVLLLEVPFLLNIFGLFDETHNITLVHNILIFKL